MTTLNRFETNQAGYAGAILNKLLGATSEKQRATDLVFGTIRNRLTIDMVIAKLADCPAERVSKKLLNIIRVGIYELIYCPSTSDYAAVNEAVNIAKAVAGKKGAGFVNAVLRQVTRNITNRQQAILETDIEKTIPQTPSTGCEFDCNILPNPKTSPADYLNGAFSLPKWLVAGWVEVFGFEKSRQICFASNRKGGIYLRINPLKTTAEQLSERLGQADIDFELAAEGAMIGLKGAQAVAQLPGFAEGLFSVQDITARQAVEDLSPQQGWRILDMCAAPGGKTCQLAEATADKAEIIATDIDKSRLTKVNENIKRLGVKSVRVIEYEDLAEHVAKEGDFDCILLDVPCSNTGVLSKRPEVRYRINSKAVARLVEIQTKLLAKAVKMIKPTGRILYSTCSIERAENTELINHVLKQNGFELEAERLTLPCAEGFGCDGGYTAIIKHWG